MCPHQKDPDKCDRPHKHISTLTDLERNAYTRWTESGMAKRHKARLDGRPLPDLVTPKTPLLKAAPAKAQPQVEADVVQGHVTKAPPKAAIPHCMAWLRGDCAKGDACPAAHSKRFRNKLSAMTVPPVPKG